VLAQRAAGRLLLHRSGLSRSPDSGLARRRALHRERQPERHRNKRAEEQMRFGRPEAEGLEAGSPGKANQGGPLARGERVRGRSIALGKELGDERTTCHGPCALRLSVWTIWATSSLPLPVSQSIKTGRSPPVRAREVGLKVALGGWVRSGGTSVVTPDSAWGAGLPDRARSLFGIEGGDAGGRQHAQRRTGAPVRREGPLPPAGRCLTLGAPA